MGAKLKVAGFIALGAVAGALATIQVQAVAQKYFSDDQLTVGTLEPLPVSAQAERKPDVSGLRH